MSAVSFASLVCVGRARRGLSGLALLATTALSAPALADFPAVIELSALNGATGFRIDGIDNGDFAGWSVAAVDINGDGMDDVAIGARGADPGGRSSAGEIYVVFGKANFPSALALSALNSNNGVRLDGIEPGDSAGVSIARAGDVNGDRVEDLLIGAVGADPAGESYVLYGKRGSFGSALSLSTLNGATGFRIDGVAASDYSGGAVAGAGDTNGDGYDDVLIGASFADRGSRGEAGQSYVVYGRPSFTSVLALSSLDGANGFRLQGIDASDQSGRAVAGVGDFNRDGFDDVLIGAPAAEKPGAPANTDSGESYLVPGGPSPRASLFDLGIYGDDEGIVFRGTGLFDFSGVNVTDVGDFNGDGVSDLGIGAPYANYADADNGKGYVVFGKQDIGPEKIQLNSLNGTNGFALKGAGPDDRAGSDLTYADVNGDGFTDLVVGAPRGSPGAGRSEAGRIHVVFGHTGSSPAVIQASALDGANGFTINGATADDYSSFSLSGADINGDGVGDIIIGGPGSAFGSGPGKAYVVFGKVPDVAVTRIGSAAGQYITGGRRADTIMGGGGDDTVEGRGGPDELVGGGGKDVTSYKHAKSSVTVNFVFPEQNAGEAFGDTLTGFEGIEGSKFADSLTGDIKANNFLGGAGDDFLDGLGGSDRLNGGPGKDTLQGGTGADVFDFDFVNDSTPGSQRDQINDFKVAEGDKVDLRDIDARPDVPGDQAFTFIGQAAFTGQKGQLRVSQSGPHATAAGDVNGDRQADFEIQMRNTQAADVAAGNFVR